MAPFRQTTLPAHRKPENYTFGRPTSYRPEYCTMVFEAMRDEGLSLTAFAGLIEVDVSSCYEWIKQHADFSHAVARARAARTLWLERKLLKSRKGAETSAAIFALKNAAPHEWRDLKQTQHSHSIRVETLSDQQLNAIAAGQSAADAGVIEGEYERVEP